MTDKKKPKNCRNCGKPIETGLFCSNECRNAYVFELILRPKLLLSGTKLEKAGCRMLDEMGVSYVSQYVVKGTLIADVLVPEEKLRTGLRSSSYIFFRTGPAV